MSMSAYQEALTRVKDAREAAKVAAKDAFRLGSAELFEKHADLKSFGWDQYTPYFNDGDACTFSANIDGPNINGERGGEIEYGDEFIALRPLQEPVSTFLASFDGNDLLELFGDHKQITVHRDGTIEEDECEHD